MAQKPNMPMILGIGKKKPKPEDPPEPPGAAGAPPDDAEPDPGDPNEPMEMAAGAEPPLDGGGGSDLTPDMLDYHDGTQSCGNCTMYTAPSTCSRWPDPVEDAGWCKGFVPNTQAAAPEAPGAPPAGPPAGPPGGLPV